MELPHTTLYFRDGSSDKVYQCAITSKNEGYEVNFAFGRRGGTLKAGTKTSTPVTLEEAKKIYGKLIGEKTSKGYTPGEDGTPYTQTEHERKTTGYVPQLLNLIEKEAVDTLIKDTTFIMQEKMDGERMILIAKEGTVKAANKQGLAKGFSSLLEKQIKTFNVTLDGEAIGDNYYAFDILELNGQDLRKECYETRYEALVSFIKSHPFNTICVVPTAQTPKEKLQLFTALKEEGKEGCVFKKLGASYVSGRPASGGNQLKFKFYATASCRVTCINDKRSIGVSVLEGKKWIDIGNVTIPSNHIIPQLDAIVEIRYLYAYKGAHSFSHST